MHLKTVLINGMRSRRKWIRRRNQVEKINEKLDKENKSPSMSNNELWKLLVVCDKRRKECEDALNEYHDVMNKYIERKLKQIDPNDHILKSLIEKEIKGIKFKDDWKEIFDVFKRYGVQP